MAVCGDARNESGGERHADRREGQGFGEIKQGKVRQASEGARRSAAGESAMIGLSAQEELARQF